MLASWADLRAARERIPRGLGPFDGGFTGHYVSLPKMCSAMLTADSTALGFAHAKQSK